MYCRMLKRKTDPWADNALEGESGKTKKTEKRAGKKKEEELETVCPRAQLGP